MEPDLRRPQEWRVAATLDRVVQGRQGRALFSGHPQWPRDSDPRHLVRNQTGLSSFSGRLFRRWRQNLGARIHRRSDANEAVIRARVARNVTWHNLVLLQNRKLKRL